MLNLQTGHKYCPKCEMWHFLHERPQKQKIEDVVKMPPRDLANLPKTQFDYDGMLNQCVLKSLQTKLYFLSTLLNSEVDCEKINGILSAIKICLEDIAMLKTIEFDS